MYTLKMCVNVLQPKVDDDEIITSRDVMMASGIPLSNISSYFDHLQNTYEGTSLTLAFFEIAIFDVEVHVQTLIHVLASITS